MKCILIDWVPLKQLFSVSHDTSNEATLESILNSMRTTPVRGTVITGSVFKMEYLKYNHKLYHFTPTLIIPLRIIYIQLAFLANVHK